MASYPIVTAAALFAVCTATEVQAISASNVVINQANVIQKPFQEVAACLEGTSLVQGGMVSTPSILSSKKKQVGKVSFEFRYDAHSDIEKTDQGCFFAMGIKLQDVKFIGSGVQGAAYRVQSDSKNSVIKIFSGKDGGLHADCAQEEQSLLKIWHSLHKTSCQPSICKASRL